MRNRSFQTAYGRVTLQWRTPTGGYGDNLGTGFPEMVEIWEGTYGEKPVLNERYELQIVELSFGGMIREEKNGIDNALKMSPKMSPQINQEKVELMPSSKF